MDRPIDKEMEVAQRALERCNDPTLLAGEGMLIVYCSLRKIHGRVSHNMLREHYKHTHEFKQGCTVETALWLVPKFNFANACRHV